MGPRLRPDPHPRPAQPESGVPVALVCRLHTSWLLLLNFTVCLRICSSGMTSHQIESPDQLLTELKGIFTLLISNWKRTLWKILSQRVKGSEDVCRRGSSDQKEELIYISHCCLCLCTLRPTFLMASTCFHRQHCQSQLLFHTCSFPAGGGKSRAPFSSEALQMMGCDSQTRSPGRGAVRCLQIRR